MEVQGSRVTSGKHAQWRQNGKTHEPEEKEPSHLVPFAALCASLAGLAHCSRWEGRCQLVQVRMPSTARGHQPLNVLPRHSFSGNAY